MKHEPDPDDPARCRATDLLISDCSGCRGSDETFVNQLLRKDPEPDYGEPDTEPTRDEELAGLGLRPVTRSVGRGGKWWLDTGRHGEIIPDSHPFKSSYTGSICQVCRQVIRTGQQIQHVNTGSYAHVVCLEEK